MLKQGLCIAFGWNVSLLSLNLWVSSLSFFSFQFTCWRRNCFCQFLTKNSFVCLLEPGLCWLSSLRYLSARSSVPCVSYELEARSWFSLIQVWFSGRISFLLGFMYVPLFRLWYRHPWHHVCSPDLEFGKVVVFSFSCYHLHLILKCFLERNFIEKPHVINCFGYPEVQFVQERWIKCLTFSLVYLFSNQVAFWVVFRGVQWVSCE